MIKENSTLCCFWEKAALKVIVFSILFGFNNFDVFSQEYENLTISQPITETYTPIARDYIILDENFEVEATDNLYFEASINPNLLFTPGVDSQLGGTSSGSAGNGIVGLTPGAFNISPTGGATYSVPITISPGTAGMQPELSIVYNSQGGNGIMGRGFSLAGLSAITRVPSTLYHNNYVDGVDFDDTDMFALDGQRLIMIGNGQYGADGMEYRTENNTFSKIISRGNVGNGPSWFEVYTKSGLIIEYGKTQRLIASSQGVVYWAVEKITDQTGNYMTFSYNIDQATGEQYLSSINYTANDGIGLNSYASVNFLYEELNAAYVNSSYINGYKTSITKRLKTIESKYGNDMVRKYEMGYNYNSAGYVLQLTSITEYSGDGNHLNPIVFDWGNNNIASSSKNKNIYPSLQSDKFILYFGDFNGDSKADYIKVPNKAGGSYNPNTDKYELYINDGTGNNYTKVKEGTLRSDFEPEFSIVGDIDGDGEDEWIRTHFTSNNKLDFFLLDYTYVYYSTPQYDWRFNPADFRDQNGNIILTEQFSLTDPIESIKIGDFTGDGRNEVAVIFRTSSRVILAKHSDIYGNPSFVASYDDINDFANPISHTRDAEEVYFDMEGDGIQNLVSLTNSGFYSYKFSGSGNTVIETFIGSSPNLSVVTTNSSGVLNMLPGDFNGDGKTDLFTIRSNGQNVISISTGISFINHILTTNFTSTEDLYIADINGDGSSELLDVKIKNGSDNIVVYKYFNQNLNSSSTFHYPNYDSDFDYEYYFKDLSGDGNIEMLGSIIDSSPDQSLHRILWFYEGKEGHIVQSITNSLGYSTAITYAPLTDDNVYTASTTSSEYPLFDINIPLYVVSNTQLDNGIGGTTDVEFSYEGARSHLQGRGFLGFTSTISKNLTTGLEVENTYEINPIYFVTALKRSETRLGNSLIKTVDNINEIKTYNGASGVFSFLTSNTTSNTYNGESDPVTFNIVDFIYDDYGNVTDLTENIAGQKTITANNIYDNDASNWKIGYLEKTTIDNATQSQPTLTTVTDYLYYSNGLLKEESYQKDDAVSTKNYYTYDGYGNVTSVATTGINTNEGLNETRTITTQYEDTHHRFPKSITNAVGQTTLTEYDPLYGNIEKSTDPNGFITDYQYDDFGYITKILYHDGTQSITTKYWAQPGGNAPSNVEYYVYSQVSGETPVIEYYDKLGRLLRTQNTGFNGETIFTDTQYNEKGQVEKTSAPYFKGETIVWTVSNYDDLGRLDLVTIPRDSGSDGSTEYQYSGLETTVTTNGQSTVTTKNKLGQVVSIQDNMSNTIVYDYDSHGNLRHTTDPKGNVIEMQYDIFGNKIKLIDPDLGTVNYIYNGFGELITRTDAKNNSTSYDYDALGRVDKRTEVEGVTDWVYDTKNNGIGQLASVTAPNNISKDYIYDDYGRLNNIIESIDGENFSTQYTFDVYGRVENFIYPSGFTVKHVFNDNGYLQKVVNEDKNITYWEAQEINARGQLKKFKLGNGLETMQTYKPKTGNIESINTGAGAVQDLAFVFDNIGRLDFRYDYKNNLTEDFGYDDLNRLKTATVSGVGTVSVDYDELGNIKYKSDVGTYVYNGAGPHAVTAINGNEGTISQLTSNLTWTSFDKVATIDEDDAVLAFTYGIDHERKKEELSVDGQVMQTTLYVGGIYEKKTDGQGVAKELHYIFAGGENVAIYTTGTGAGTRYLHHDHLGSTQSITDEAGNLVEELSFDPWGKRRNPDGTTLSGNTSFEFERGFTGHEHMDLFALVNMNGRVYDPVIGRFLSADPIIQDPFNLQSFNRYSYVYNSPLNYIDPSGYIGETLLGAIIGATVGATTGYLLAEATNQNNIGRRNSIVGGFIVGATLGGLVGYGIDNNWFSKPHLSPIELPTVNFPSRVTGNLLVAAREFALRYGDLINQQNIIPVDFSAPYAGEQLVKNLRLAKKLNSIDAHDFYLEDIVDMSTLKYLQQENLGYSSFVSAYKGNLTIGNQNIKVSILVREQLIKGRGYEYINKHGDNKMSGFDGAGGSIPSNLSRLNYKIRMYNSLQKGVIVFENSVHISQKSDILKWKKDFFNYLNGLPSDLKLNIDK